MSLRLLTFLLCAEVLGAVEEGLLSAGPGLWRRAWLFGRDASVVMAGFLLLSRGKDIVER